VFLPSGGVKGVPGVVSMISSKADDIPYIILDSDKSGVDAKKKLLSGSGLYCGFESRILDIKDYTGMDGSEVEDLISFKLLQKGINKIFTAVDEPEFEDNYDSKNPIVHQIESFARENSIELEKGWKVNLAMNFKIQLRNKKPADIPNGYLEIWTKLFKDFLPK